uniref:Uncharacterized protein n=1 Tax=Panagrolaimus sp. ES5 TaxID=591445 RepID=A0AC34GRG6_9BILA
MSNPVDLNARISPSHTRDILKRGSNNKFEKVLAVKNNLTSVSSSNNNNNSAKPGSISDIINRLFDGFKSIDNASSNREKVLTGKRMLRELDDALYDCLNENIGKREIMVPAKKPFIGPMNKQFERAEEIERERTVETDTEPMEVEY